MQSNESSARREKVVARLAEEARRFVVMFVYLWVMLGLFVLLDAMTARQQGGHFTWSFGLASLNALVMAKVMLLAEDFKIGERIRARPLIFPVLGEAFLMAILFIAFHVVEKELLGLLKGETAAASVPHIGGGGFVGLLGVALILFVSMIPFFAFRRIGQELEPGRLNAMMFGHRIKIVDDRQPAPRSA